MISLQERLVDAALCLKGTATKPGEHHILACYPFVQGNPFQRMQYAAGMQAGCATLALDDYRGISAPLDDVPLLVHYHWVHGLLATAASPDQAQQMVGDFLDHVDRQRQNGCRILWTVHNILSHAGKFHTEECQLRAGLADRADHLHIMNPDSVQLCAPKYRLDPSKIISVPHPSYSGVYGSYMDAGQARLDLGLLPGDKALLLFGAMGPHKGILRLLSMLDRLQDVMAGRIKLFVVGRAGTSDFMEELRQAVAGRADVRVDARSVDDQTLQLYFKAADAVICPYPRVLNSGVAMTAASYGRPVIVPQALEPVFSGAPGLAHSFDPGNFETVIAAMLAAFIAGADAGSRQGFRAWAQKRNPAVISRAFFAELLGKNQLQSKNQKHSKNTERHQ